MAALLVTCVPLHCLWRAAGRPSPWTRRFLAGIAYTAGFDGEAIGVPLRRDVLFAANHLSWVDIPLIAAATGARFVSKAEVRAWPGIGFLAGLNRTVYVARAERGRVAEQAGTIRDALAEGTPVAMFPEGTTGDGTGVGPFRAALLAALLPALPGVRLQPVAIDYHGVERDVAWSGRGGGFGGELVRLLGLPGRRRVTLRFLDPIDPAAAGDRKAMTAQARRAIVAALGERAPAPL